MRNQKEGETISVFVANLRRLSEHCKYEAILEDMMRDRLVCGVRDKRIQQRLLAETELNFKKARDIALAAETASRGSLDLQANKPNPAGTWSEKGSLLKVHQHRGRKRVTSSKHHHTSIEKPCYRCGGTNHDQKDCRFRDAECHLCKKKGHIAKVCRSKPRSNTLKQTHKVTSGPTFTNETQDEEILALFHTKSTSDPITITVLVDEEELLMEVDTGASVSLISEVTYKELWTENKPHLRKTNVKLRTYSGEFLNVLGSVTVNVTYGNQKKNLPLMVVAGNGPSICGKNWLQKIRLDRNTLLHKISTDISDFNQNLSCVLQKHPEVFNEELGLVKDYSADIHVTDEATPRFHKARPVPYALRDKVDADLDRLQREGIIEPVKYSKWAAPIVPVVKPNGSLRICGDYKTTVNTASKHNKYPLPRIDDLFSRLEGGTTFSKLDLSSAFQQIPLNEDSRKYTTINTSKGLFQYTRLPFGITSAPSIFQRVMDSLLNGLPGLAVYIDDILVTGKTEDNHLRNLDQVLNCLANAGFRLNRSKCTFLPEIQYLGHIISAEGIRPCMEKVRALQEAPIPINVQQLRPFLGAVNYYRKFISNLSDLLTPLNELLQKDRRWSWEKRQMLAFKEAKRQLKSTQVLTHYDPKKPLLLSCDASP